jgi:ribonucleoside-triphosphate reductase
VFSFTLSEAFLETYKTRRVDWGYVDAAGTSLGEITFIRTYSRLKADGTKERWWEVCRRVIEGMYSIQKDHAKTNRLPWNDHKAQRSAQEAFERLFSFKWTPPGRGLWMMGTPLVNQHRNSAALQNCAFISTGDMTLKQPSAPFLFLMEASMLGIGVGFDTKGADKGFKLHDPEGDYKQYTIEDSREGWVESVRLLLDSYLVHRQHPVVFDYSLIRPAGEPIKSFGGTAAGPGPLIRLHQRLRKILSGREGQDLTSRDIADVGNLIGACVVSGNVRRSAELLIGNIEDKEFLNLKNSDMFPERNAFSDNPDVAGWGWMSNNSVSVNVGDDLTAIIDGIARNGEPGVIWMDMSRKFGRIIDGENNKDWRVAGFNPCAEQSLESGECCTLVETYLNRHDSLEDFQRTIKFAYLYAKTVTLLPTHWPQTNAIMQRNRRIGCSISGMANFTDRHGMNTLKRWLNAGYDRVKYYDSKYSEWLCVRESIKMTTVKPSGTVSILAGESPGVHWTPGGEYFNRALRFGKDDPMVTVLRQCGYNVETDVANPDTTVVAYFPIHSKARRSEKAVKLFEKANLAVVAQRYWSDNSVSVTLSFDESEADDIGTVLHMHEGQLKTVSFLPMDTHGYPQAPYSEITPEDYENATMHLFPANLEDIYNNLGVDALGERYCTTDVCLVKADG